MDGERLDALLERYCHEGDLLVLLKDAQAACGGLTEPVLLEIAARLSLPVADLYGVASFYSSLSPKPRGRHTLAVCRSVPCRMGGSDTLLALVQDELAIVPGETTSDGRISLELTNCVGACDHRSALIIDGERLGDLSASELKATLARLD